MGKTNKEEEEKKYKPKGKKFNKGKYSNIKDASEFIERELDKDNDYDDGYDNFEKFSNRRK